MPDGTTVKSLTVSNPNGIAAGIDSLYNSFHSNLYTTNFEAHWRGDRAQINASIQYNWSNEGNYFVEQILRPVALTSASADFASDQYKSGVPSITLNGAALSDVRTYVVDRSQYNQSGSNNKELTTEE